MAKFAKLTLVGALVACPAYAAGDPGWIISEATPGVTVLHAGRALIGERHARLEAGDVVLTGGNARAVLVRGEEYAMVAPNSRLQLTAPADASGFTQVLERWGNVVYSIKKKVAPHFTVETPFLAAVVKGTTFSVTVDATGASVQVIEGAVEVATRDRGAHYLVLPGDIANVAATSMRTLSIDGKRSQTIQSTAPLAPAAPAAPAAS